MTISITARGYKAPDRLKSYIYQKLKRVERISDRLLKIEVILSYEKLDQWAEFKTHLNQKDIIVKEKSEDIFKSIDLAIDNLERQINKVKDKTKEHSKRKIVERLET
ncbi:MAG: ribosome-associated translation inhibitor RaiA [Caldithrix sp.]|nr:ribosome-associated translation inhibitor RaiA [Caldithrix sp.]